MKIEELLKSKKGDEYNFENISLAFNLLNIEYYIYPLVIIIHPSSYSKYKEIVKEYDLLYNGFLHKENHVDLFYGYNTDKQ